jgi:uncharacterized protein YciI
MFFIITAIDKPDAFALRTATREAHLAFVNQTETVRLAGPVLDEKGDMAGSHFIVEAPDLAAIKAWHAQDPYVKAGLFQSSEIRPWKATINRCGAKL